MASEVRAEELLHRLFAADKAAREARDALLALDDRAAIFAVLGREVERVNAGGVDPGDASLVLARVVKLLGSLDGREGTRLLVSMLGHPDPEVDDLVHVAIEERLSRCFEEVEEALEAAVDEGRSSAVCASIANILGFVRPPSALRVLTKLSSHPDGDVVVPAIEALVKLQEPSTIDAIARLCDDHRTGHTSGITTEEGVHLTMATTVGQCARHAIEQIRGAEGESETES